jgi:transposase
MKVLEVLRLTEMGLKQTEIAQSVNCARSTVGDIQKRCHECGLTYSDAKDMTSDKINDLIYPDSSGKKPVKGDPDWQSIHSLLTTRKRMNLQYIWEEYRKSDPDGLSYSRFCARYNEWKDKTGKNVVMPQDREPGREMFVDWIGDTPGCVINRATGVSHKANFFVATLGDSSYPFVQAFPDQKLDKWLTAHVNAFRWYGGIPLFVVPDNCRTAITKPQYYDPVINKDYNDLARYYDIAVVPARVRRPRDKASVESGVGWLETWLLEWLHDQLFFSFEALNTAICNRILELVERPFKNRPGTRKSVFESLDKPALRQLPLRQYEVVNSVSATVASNYHVQYDNFYYSVHYSHYGEKVTIRATATTIEIVNANMERLTTHPRHYTGNRYITNPDHMPENHRHQYEANHRDGDYYRRWANNIGPYTYQVIDRILTSVSFEEQAYKSCMGLLQLINQYGNQGLEAACNRAVDLNSVTYTTVRNILKNGQQSTPMSKPGKALPAHSNLRSGSWS